MTTSEEFIEDFLAHKKAYDPVYAREYYLRTRKLKGRKPASREDALETKSLKVSSQKNRLAVRARALKKLEMQFAQIEKLFTKAVSLANNVERMSPGPVRDNLERQNSALVKKIMPVLEKMEKEAVAAGVEEETIALIKRRTGIAL